MQILHKSTGALMQVTKETARDYVCKVVSVTKETPEYIKVGSVQKVAKRAIGILYEII